MAQTDHVEALKVKHAALDNELDTENNRPMPDMLHVAELKRQKLAIKDEIERLTHH